MVCPGGGFNILAWDLEGTEAAEWLNSLGTAAVVLKYRAPTRELGEAGDVAPEKALGPMMDAQRALSLTRAHAKEWGIDRRRVGILGFSAGGQAAALAAVALGKRAYAEIDMIDTNSCSADFAMLIYPGGLADSKTGELKKFFPVSAETPPMFFTHAADDRVTCLSSAALFSELKKAKVPAALHVFANGGHGYGLRPTVFPVTRWPDQAADWLREMKLLDRPAATDSVDPLALNFHLMHPGGDSKPGDPNAAFHLDGTFHLHYILSHPWKVKGKTRKGFSFVHVTSPDMLHWTWQRTKLQPSFTGHGMYSGTGFLTKEGRPAAIYHGAGSRRNQIVIAKDRRLSAWEKPFPVEPKTSDGQPANIKHWDPDCFLIGDTYYAFSGGRNPPLLKSIDLKNWTHIGDFLAHEPDDVAIGEDVSCGNFFPLGDKWMLLCISHPFGCRYYLGDWNAETEQFVPETHGRMNWRSDEQDTDSPKEHRNFFAPESLLTADGRRVMWAWLTTLETNALRSKTIQSLPRELSLRENGTLRIEPLRELKQQRLGRKVYENIKVIPEVRVAGGEGSTRLTQLNGDAYEIRITIDRQEAARKRFGFRLFTGRKHIGIPIYFQPYNRTIRVGDTEAPFAVSDLPAGEDVELNIFIDKYLVEVFVNGRQAVVTADLDWQNESGFHAYAWGAPLTIRTVEIWSMKPTNQGYLEAQRNRVWEPDKE